MLSSKKVIRKAGPGTQCAALCFRLHKTKSDKFEILLITSRGTGRWIPPKGWPIGGLSPAQSAAQEALEEAGVKGRIYEAALGRYEYFRAPPDLSRQPTEAYIFPLHVSHLARTFKEKGQRQVKWFSPKKAAAIVREPKLKKIIRGFDPKKLTPA